MLQPQKQARQERRHGEGSTGSSTALGFGGCVRERLRRRGGGGARATVGRAAAAACRGRAWGAMHHRHAAAAACNALAARDPLERPGRSAPGNQCTPAPVRTPPPASQSRYRPAQARHSAAYSDLPMSQRAADCQALPKPRYLRNDASSALGLHGLSVTGHTAVAHTPPETVTRRCSSMKHTINDSFTRALLAARLEQPRHTRCAGERVGEASLRPLG